MPQVSQDFVDGLREGRETLKIVNPSDPVAFAACSAANLRGLIDRFQRMAASARGIEFLRGELAFWESQGRKQP